MKLQALPPSQQIEQITFELVQIAMQSIAARQSLMRLHQVSPWWSMCFYLQGTNKFDFQNLQASLDIEREEVLQLLLIPNYRPSLSVIQKLFKLYLFLQRRYQMPEISTDFLVTSMNNSILTRHYVSETCEFFLDRYDDNHDKKLRALIVDDVNIVRQLHCNLLKGMGFIAIGASDGRAALKQSPKKFDLILLDMQLPDIDGFELTKVIRAQPWQRAIKIIAVTSCTHLDEKFCQLMGIDQVLFKPLVFSHLNKICQENFYE